ncbi:Protein kinase protein rad53 [Parahypoxylon ruwenzoriense]
MDSNDDSQATQPATQNALDPRRFGKQNSGFSDEDISDIICLLYPNSDGASREVLKIASSPKYAHHTAGRYTADAIDSDLYLEDDAREFGRTRGIGDHALVIKLSSPLKDPCLGFTFGRNRSRCDLCFAYDPGKRLSNIHFRIFVNKHGSVMLEDQSTNGTVVDGKLLRKRSDPQRPGQVCPTKRVLESGSTIRIVMHQSTSDLVFLVRIPRRDGDHETAYRRKLAAYLRRTQEQDDDPNKTIGPGPSGHVNLFPTARDGRRPTDNRPDVMQEATQRLPREWRGGEKYARVGVIGKGAFATVHKVTSKYDGSPYAAKELDKRRFIKNGVLDQKVENEMRIMQRVSHPNIVKYIEHFDWDLHEFIIIMEYVPGGDLGKLIQDHGSIVEPHVKVMAEQLLSALEYLHGNKITHRDVKPDNILIQSTNPLVVKLTDFGLSKMIDTEQTYLKTFCGTLLYCAPEVYSEYSSYDNNGVRTQRKGRRAVDRERYDHAVDIWSLGGVLFYALTGAPPFPVNNGVTYTQLLDRIIKTPLNVSPLSQLDVSRNGIHFLNRMIHVRPETRASIPELQAHPWLASGLDPFDDDSADEELGQGASQLSLDDRYTAQFADPNVSSLMEPEPDLSIDYESEKENYTFEHRPNRLFGEVNTSAIGSSGVISENRLNLLTPVKKFGETDMLETEILDSFEESEDFSTPRQNHQPSHVILSVSEDSSQNHSRNNSQSIVLGTGSQPQSQSLGGASSILGNLNVKSLANDDSSFQSRMSDLSSSKRKPAYDASDEYEAIGVEVKPSIKRLKSQVDVEFPSTGEDEISLLASVPQVANNKSGRQIDYPLPKTTFWDSSNKDTWHLNYPEMTHLQYYAFELAAKKRKEEFCPGKSRLWGLAMRNFPPTRNRQQPKETGKALALRPAILKRDSQVTSEVPDRDIAPKASPMIEEESESIPDTLPPETQTPPATQVIEIPKTVAAFYSAQGSLVPGISISLKDPVISWGRDRNNTVVYEPVIESKVPKNAFRVVLWRDGYNASFHEFRPWEPGRSEASRTMRASPEPYSYAFYISTKATNGIRINNSPLKPNEPKDSTAACRYWVKLYHGDTIVFWGTEHVHSQAKLTFECYWGGSSSTRPADEPPTCIPEPQARKLDRLWPKAVTTLHYDKIKAEAQRDQEMRMRHMDQELERSRIFEQKRAEAVKALASRASRRASPATAPTVGGGAVTQFLHNTPSYLQSSGYD